MFGFLKSPANKVSKQKSVDPGFLLVLTLLIQILNLIPSKLLSLRGELLQTMCVTPNFNTNPFDDDDDGRREASSLSSSYSGSAVARDRYKNDFHGSGGLQNQSVQELENYAVYKAEETTKTVNSCLKIAGDIREDATRSLVMLHQQGEQITRTHMMAANTERDLSEGEKLLNNLGGMFSKTWKPKKSREITGPIIVCRPWLCSMQCLHCGSCKYDYLSGSYHNNFTCT